MTAPRIVLRDAQNPLRDPGVTIGDYRVLERTDGLYVLYDERLPKTGAVAWIGKTKAAAEKEAKRLVSAGAPIVIWVNNKQRPLLDLIVNGDGGESALSRSKPQTEAK